MQPIFMFDSGGRGEEGQELELQTIRLLASIPWLRVAVVEEAGILKDLWRIWKALTLFSWQQVVWVALVIKQEPMHPLLGLVIQHLYLPREEVEATMSS
jgi:hypothetical protein